MTPRPALAITATEWPRSATAWLTAVALVGAPLSAMAQSPCGTETCYADEITCTTICVNVPAPAGTVCRAKVGACDAVETCDGVNITCPSDRVALAGTVCRTAASACDVVETCDGVNATCPSDAFSSNSTCSSFGLLAPGNGAPGVGSTPTLTWSTRPGATGYTVEVVPSAASWAAPLIRQPVTTSHYTVPAGTLTGATYQWRVIAVANGATVDTAGPFSFTATTPTDTAQQCTRPECYYDDISCQTICDTVIAPAGVVCRPKASDCDIAETCDGINSICPADALAPNCDAFSLLMPADGTAGANVTPLLSWTVASGAAFYRVEIVNSGGDWLNATQETVTTSPYSVLPGGLAANSSYQWRVTALTAWGSKLSVAGPFTFSTVPVVTLSAPPNGATVGSLTPELQWQPALGASSYKVELAQTNADWSAPLVSQIVTSTSYIVAANAGLVNGMMYQWRVTAMDSFGAAMTEGGPLSFLLDVAPPSCSVCYYDDVSCTTVCDSYPLTPGSPCAPPGPPALAAPGNGGRVWTLTPVLSWSVATGATLYKLDLIKADGDWSTPLWTMSTTASPLTVPPAILSDGNSYFWQVTALNGNGSTPSSNGPSSFTASCPAQSKTGFAYDDRGRLVGVQCTQ